MTRLKFYAAMFAIIIGLLVSFNQTATAQTIVNPSFETDPRPPGTGYGAITGWNGGSGLNTSTGPFADNGAIPDGQNVAFIQGAGTMTQNVSGFTIGEQYRLRYYENARNCCAPRTANLQVNVGGAAVVPLHEVAAVGGTNSYFQKFSQPFTATAQSLEIAFITSGTGDFSLLLDKIEIEKVLVVTNGNDAGPGSLRQTIFDAPAGSTITFSPSMPPTVSLSSGEISFNKNLTIAGPGADRLEIFGLINDSNTVTVSGLTITRKPVINGGNLTLADSTVKRVILYTGI